MNASNHLPWAELEAFASGDPAEALRYCDTSLAGTNTQEFTVDLLRAKALAHRALGQTAASLSALQQAASLAETLGDRALQARVDMSLSATMVLDGRADEGLALLEPSRHDVDDVTRSMIDIQRAGLLVRIGRLEESLDSFRTAFDATSADLPAVFEADGRSNRAIALALSGRLRHAEREFERAKRIYEREGLSSGVADALVNLGWIAGLTGDVPLAFRCFDEAEARHVELGIPTAVVAQNRCDTFLAAGLASEARATAMRAVEHMDDAPSLERADTLLRLARAELADGDPVAAEATAAAAEATAVGMSDDLIVQARVLGIEARRRSGRLERADLDQLVVRIDRLVDSTNTLLAAELRLTAALVAQALDDPVSATRLLADVDRRRLSIPQRVTLALLVARLGLASADLAGARRALAAGRALLARHRASIGATELRVKVAVHAAELALLGLDMAFESGRPASVVEWVELTRSASLHTSRSSRSHDPVLEGLLDEMRIVLDQISHAPADGPFPAGLIRRREDLQRQIVWRSRHESGGGVDGSAGFRAKRLRDALGDSVFVSFIDHGGQTFAAVVTAQRTRLVPIGRTAALELEAGQLRRACTRAFAASDASRRAAHASLATQSANRLDSMLFGSIRLGDRSLVLSPPAVLQATPWGCLPSLRSRSFVVTASALTWLSPAEHAGTGPAALIAGPNLRHADEEIDLVASIIPTATASSARGSNCTEVLARLEGSRLAHIASHGTFVADHPMLSGLELTDGRMTAYDIERLAHPPPLFVITACHGGLSATHPGEELIGFTTALISLGVGNVIACGVPVPDDVRTLSFIEELHRRLASGLAPPDALCAARTESVDPLVSGAFTCFGRRAEPVNAQRGR